MAMAATNLKVRELDDENNMMWDWIKETSTVIGEKPKGFSIDKRQSFLTDNAKVRPAEGKHSPPKHLSTTKQYRGPDIKPLMPKYVQEQINY
jgi:hypothetical protein